MTNLKNKNLPLLIIVLLMSVAGLYVLEPAKNYNRMMLKMNLREQVTNTWNWCPHKVEKIEVVASGRVLRNKSDLAATCIAAIDQNLSAASDQDFKLCLRAFANDGTVTFLECSPDQKTFRTSGLTFQSKRLTYALRSY